MDGIWIQNAPDNWIGGDEPSSGNVIAGNDRDGIRITGKIEGNRCREEHSQQLHRHGQGRDGDGLGNPLGILIENAAENQIGDVDKGHVLGNIIAGNFGAGVLIRNTQKTLFPVTLDN